MRVLLDENLPRRLKRHFAEGIQAVTVQERGWSEKRNGELLSEAQSEFEAFLTTDQGIPRQQNLALLSIAIILMEAPSNRLPDPLPLMPKVNEAPNTLVPGQLIRIAA